MEVFAQMQVNGSQCHQAVRFFKLWNEFRRGDVDVSKVEWRGFSPLFVRYKSGKQRNQVARKLMLETKLGDKPGDPNLVAYAVFLEIECEDRAWTRKYYESIWNLTIFIGGLANPDLSRKLERFRNPVAEFPDESLESQRKKARQKRDALKVRKFRQKKRAICVTSPSLVP